MSCPCILKHKLKLQAGAKHIGSKKLQSHLLLLSVERQGRSCVLLEHFFQFWSFTFSLAHNAKQVTSTTSKILIFKQISIGTGHAQSKAQYRPTEKWIWLRHMHRKDDVDRQMCIITPMSLLVLIQLSQYLPRVMDLEPSHLKIAEGLRTTLHCCVECRDAFVLRGIGIWFQI